MKAPRRVNDRRERRIHGLNAVERRLRAQPDTVSTVLLAGRSSPRRNAVAELARSCGVEVGQTDEASLRKRTGSDAHQGIAALVTAFEYSPLEELSGSGRPLLVLDRMNDPHNLGALIRTAVAAGFGGVVLPERGTSPITAAVEKAASGAVNDIPISRVVNLVRALDQLAAAGYWRLALTPRQSGSIFEIEIPTPVALVLGGESGVRRLVAEHCDFAAQIPLIGPIESLNASVAGAVAMYEVVRRQQC
jgi:23S rRNA (guanosine2251-2'-O)-methyltransferase